MHEVINVCCSASHEQETAVKHDSTKNMLRKEYMYSAGS